MKSNFARRSSVRRPSHNFLSTYHADFFQIVVADYSGSYYWTFLALLCAAAQQSYCRYAGIRLPRSVFRRPSVKSIFSETFKQINGNFLSYRPTVVCRPFLLFCVLFFCCCCCCFLFFCLLVGLFVFNFVYFYFVCFSFFVNMEPYGRKNSDEISSESTQQINS